VTDTRTLIVSHAEVAQLLPMSRCIDVMAETLGAMARGNALLPLRQVLRLRGGHNLFATMPAVVDDAIGAKIITVFPGNAGSELESHIGVVLYFAPADGRLLAIIDASSVTAIRTAAVSGLATRLLANADAADLAILGTGVQAMTHLDAMRAVRPITRVRVWSRDPANGERFANDARRRFDLPVEVAPSAEAAVRGATLICTTTASRTPVLAGAWLSPGVHINAVGASLPTARELDAEAVARSRLFVDRRESTLAEAGDFLLAREEGAVDDGHIVAELGELVTGARSGRQHPTEITLFKSLGLAVEDVAAARFLYDQALAEGAGTWIEIGGRR
jgi:ornithine cyclodeaminase